MENIKVYYIKAIAKLSFEKFRAFILEMQKQGNKNRGYTTKQYYLLLIRGSLCNKFIETFLETI